MTSRSLLRRCAGLLLSTLLTAIGAQGAMAAGATSQRVVNPTGGITVDGSDGLRWTLGSNSQLQVRLGNADQVYNTGATPMGGSMFNSVYLRVDRGTNATTRIYTNADNAASAPFLAFTQVS